jgi:hypothetical protein
MLALHLDIDARQASKNVPDDVPATLEKKVMPRLLIVLAWVCVTGLAILSAVASFCMEYRLLAVLSAGFMLSPARSSMA